MLIDIRCIFYANAIREYGFLEKKLIDGGGNVRGGHEPWDKILKVNCNQGYT